MPDKALSAVWGEFYSELHVQAEKIRELMKDTEGAGTAEQSPKEGDLRDKKAKRLKKSD